eukprot:Opistho-2@94608
MPNWFLHRMVVSTAKAWKRFVTKVTFVGDGFTRKPPKFERFIRPMGLRFKKAHVTHPELAATFNLPIIGVKKNPQSPMYTQLGVITKGTIIEVGFLYRCSLLLLFERNCAFSELIQTCLSQVNVSELGLVTQGGKVIWGKYAQVTNNPENDPMYSALI